MANLSLDEPDFEGEDFIDDAIGIDKGDQHKHIIEV